MRATVQNRWRIYSLGLKCIPAKISFSFLPSKDYVIGKAIEPNPISKDDKILKLNLSYFEKEIIFIQKIKLNKPSTVFKGKEEFIVAVVNSVFPC